MPGLDSEHHKYVHFYYNTLGTDFGSAFRTVITRPVYTFKLLFINNTGLSENNGIKLHVHLMILAGGGWALFFRPKYLLMAIPIYCQKLFNDDPMRWGSAAHYSIEFVPLISIALFEVINSFLKSKNALWAGMAFCTFAAALSLYYIKDINDNPVRSNFLSIHHYQSSYNTEKVYKAMDLIPANASISAQTEFCPHLALRDSIFLYPEIGSARYLILSRSYAAWPLNMAEHQARITEFLSSGEWQKIYDEGNILLLKRK